MNFKNYLIIIKLLISSFILLFFANSNALADPNVLLGEAIKKSLSINDNLPQEDKLVVYSDIFNIIDKIISDHPSSDQAIKLLSNQKVGDFDQRAIRLNYINELTEYYDIVCETSPNFLCLGFVSLKKGQSGCKSASTVRSIVEAHQNLKNAINIFAGQTGNSSFLNLSLDMYRNCLSISPFQATDYSKDLFSLDLVKMILDLGKEKTAKAMIQNMKTPSFKVEGVLVLSESQGKPFDRAFYDRLVKYINEKVRDVNGSKASATLALAEDSLKRGDFIIEYDDVRDMFEHTNFGDKAKKCDAFFVRNLLKRIFSIQYSLATLNKDRRGYGKGQMVNLLEGTGKRFDIIDSCRDKSKDTGEYSLSLLIYPNILLLSKKSAEEFLKGVINEDWTGDKQINFAVRTLGEHKDLFEAEYETSLALKASNINISDQLKEAKKAKGSELVQFEQLLKQDRALFPVFKQIVDYGNVCESSKLLFQEIKGRNYFDDAIMYMIKSENIDIKKKHKCGDSELELLLN